MFKRHLKSISAALSNDINCKQNKSLRKWQNHFFKIADKSTADQNSKSQENDRLIHARMRRIRTETKIYEKKTSSSFLKVENQILKK